MPSDTFLKLPPAKQNRIYEAAVSEFCRAPFEKISIRNIVNEASIARGSFYQYFRDKEDLFVYVMHRIRQGMEDSMEEKDDFFDFIFSMAERELLSLTTEPGDPEAKTRILCNVAVSPGAQVIFEREISRNLKTNNTIYEKIRDKGFSQLNEPVRNALLDMISQSVKMTVTEVLSGKKEPAEALGGLSVKLSILKAGIGA